MKMINLILTSFILFFCSSYSWSQSQMYKTEGERLLREGFEWVPDKILNGKLLKDRFGEETRILEFSGEKSREALDLIDWWRIYANVYCAQKSESNFNHPDSVQKRIIRKDVEGLYRNNIYGASLSIISVDYSSIVDDPEDADQLTYTNGDLSFDINKAEDILNDHYCFAAAISYNGPIDNELHLRIDEENFFTNRMDDIIGIDLELNNGQSIYENLKFGDEIVLKNLLESNLLLVKMSLANGDVKHCKLNFEVMKSSDEKKSTEDPEDEHDMADFKYGLKYKIGVWYGCNSQGSINKPFIICTGFSPEFLFGLASWEWIDLNLVTLKSSYENYNNAYLLDELREHGYDIIIVQSNKGMIETDGLSYIIEDAIRWTNSWNQTGQENVIMGASQGAVSARMALARMEKNHLENGDPYHHCKTYISWEGEHKGANAALGSQAAISRLQEKFWITGWWESNLDHWFNSVVMKEYMIYNIGNTYFQNSQNPPSNPGNVAIPGPLSNFNNLQTQLHSYNHGFTEVSGYPSFVRRVGISNGGSTKNTFFLPDRLADFGRFASSAGLYQKDLDGDYDSYHGNGDKVIYQDHFRESILQIPINIEHRYYSGSFPAYRDKIDRLPGSVFAFSFFGNGIHRITCDKIGNSSLFVSYSNCAEEIQGFVPTYSGLDLNSSSSYYTTSDFNMFNTGLMFSDYPNITNGEFGFPHIGLGNQASNHTPFESLYANNENDHHVLNSDGSLKNFILWTEIQPNDLMLQDRRVGEHLISYKADFEAYHEISMGKDITVKEPVGEFVITTGTTSNIRARDAVWMYPGSSIEAGSSTLIDVGPLGCYFLGGRISGNDENEAMDRFQEELSIEAGIESVSFLIYPNPTKGEFILRMNEPEIGLVNVFDVQGTQIWTGQITSEELKVDLSLQKSGIYFVRLSTDSQVLTKRLIIQ